ncbi:Cell division trigger factor [invertebrate metagenome]|uniref:peptidylprolyl isomerase n=1 Tax=invertebrate metagenome TaxID=1711999 RepID=A0A484H665_9ZZZZ
MQLIETNFQGLKREFKVILPFHVIQSKIDARIKEICSTLRLPGFRPGKVPMKLVHKRYGSAVRADIITESVQDSTTRILEERQLRPALQPQVHILSGGNTETEEDLAFLLSVEVLPELPIVDLTTLHLERLKAEVDNQSVEDVLAKLARDRNRSSIVTERRLSHIGDLLVVDIQGMVDGRAAPDIARKDFALELGKEHFIPGFDDAIAGARAEDVCHFTLKWPEGTDKAISFVVTVKEVREVITMPVDDALAQSYGLESLDALRHIVWQQIAQGYVARSRARLKRALFDRFATDYTFEVPSGMLETELSAIWQQVTEARDKGELSPDEMAKDEAILKIEYRTMAERRVRLGLLLAEIGRTHNITITQTDVEQALEAGIKGAPPSIRQRMLEQYRHAPSVLESLKVSVFEEKIVDFILATAPITDRIVTVEELFRDDPSDPAEGTEGAAALDGEGQGFQ